MSCAPTGRSRSRPSVRCRRPPAPQLALSELAQPTPDVDRFWQPAPPLPPQPPVLTVEPDLLLRQLPLPDAALGGQALVEQLRAAYQRFATDS